MTFALRLGHNSVLVGSLIYILLEVFMLTEVPNSTGSVLIFLVN